MIRSACRILVPAIALLWLAAGAEAVIVRGGAYLKGQDDHSNILVEFTRTSPSSFYHKVLTNVSCHFTISVPPGMYTVSFTRDGYFSRSMRNVAVESEMRLPDILLIPWSTQLRVPLDFPTIQSAIDAARAADTVLVSPGRYGENLRFNGKQIVVGSYYLITRDSAFVSQTIIDGNGMGRVVTFTGGENRQTMLCGFTLTHGRAGESSGPESRGGGIFLAENTAPSLLRLRITWNIAEEGGGIHCCAGSHPLIEYSVIRNNTALHQSGGGISAKSAQLTVRNSRIEYNLSGSRGGGISADSTDIIMENAVIAENRAETEGGGFCLTASGLLLSASTVYGNSSTRGGGLACFRNSHPTISGCIVAGNIGPGGIFSEESEPVISRSDFFGNEGDEFCGCDSALGKTDYRNCRGLPCDIFDNIRLDPRFLNPAGGDFRLSPLSPCIDTGPDTNYPRGDITGTARTLPYDMGAYEGLSGTADTGLNANAGFGIDADLRGQGFQGTTWVKGMDGDSLVGFAVYATAWDVVKGYTISLDWDTSRAEFRESASGMRITDDERTVNGDTFTPVFEENALGGALISAGVQNSPGHYSISIAVPGGNSAGSAQAPVFLAVFRTAEGFTPLDDLSIRVRITIADGDGVERDLGEQYFHVLAESEIIPQPPTNVTIQDVPDDQGHSLKITWTLSASEHLGYVTRYRIYRSRSSEFTTPIPNSRFTSLDSLLYYEERYPILVDSVAVGIGEFIDPFVPVSGAPYCYWVQAVGPSGVVSKPARPEVRTDTGEQAGIPQPFTLGRAHPNPFNPSTIIEFTLSRETRVSLRIYNAAGQTVAEPIRDVRSAGRHRLVWDARGMPSGVYFYSLRAEGKVETGKMTLLK